jgi:ATP-dependent protease HslVU (ClpYQ) peptidase subunit
MTLVVGALCSDGVVIGADGAVTNGQTRNIGRKLSIFGDIAIVGASGPIGLSQRIVGEIRDLVEDGKLTEPTTDAARLASLAAIGSGLPQTPTKPWQAGQIIASAVRPHILGELTAGAKAKELFGEAIVQSVVQSTLVALPISNAPCLITIGFLGAAEIAQTERPFVSIGSGQQIADPFMLFLRRIFWNKRLPTVNEATFAVLWTLTHAIETNAGGVAEPIQIAALEHKGSEWRAREVPESEWDENLQTIGAAEEHLRAFKLKVSGTGPEAPDREIEAPPSRPPTRLETDFQPAAGG